MYAYVISSFCDKLEKNTTITLWEIYLKKGGKLKHVVKESEK